MMSPKRNLGVLTEELIRAEISENRLPVIIFGASMAGEVIFYRCQELGIRVLAFCDNNIKKTGRDYCGIPVVHTKELIAHFGDVNLLIAVADIEDIIIQVERLNYTHWYPGNIFLKTVNTFHHVYSGPAEYVDYVVKTCIHCQDNYIQPDRLFLRSVDVIITERCSLKCAHCSNLMQYYEHPQNCETTQILESIAILCSVVDEINEFRVIGGEPFMNKEIHIITRALVDESKVHNVVIYTNGTILPKPEQIQGMNDPKVMVLITDYGALSKNLEPLVQSLSAAGIRYFVDNAGGWTDCAKIEKHNRPADDLKALFTECCAKNTFTLSDDKFFRCPFSANLERLGQIPVNSADRIDLALALKSGWDTSFIKKQLRAFINNMKFMSVCDYCNGRSFDAPEIEPARQIRQFLKLDLSNIQTGMPCE